MNTEKLVKKVNKHDNDIIKVNEQLDNIVRKKIDSVPNFVLGTESNRNMCISYHNECAYYINIICKNMNNIQIKVAFYQKIKII